MNILFYSNVHLGDLHLSRRYVKWFLDNFIDVNFFYAHNQHPNALCDLNIRLLGADISNKMSQHADILVDIDINQNKFTAFNTWIGSGGLAIGCNFEACYINFTKYFNYLKKQNVQSKSNILPKLIPKIDFNAECIKKDTTNEWFAHIPQKISVLVSNNMVMSNQSYNFNMNEYITAVASNFKHINFYLTNQEQPLIKLDNVFYIEQIINNSSKFYLNDIAYFSQFCDIIVGRGSGPFSFCEIEENLNKIWISFTFEHLAADSFNGLNTFSNNGRYIHTMNLKILPELLKKDFHE